ncbi:MAG TPA: hypothetical protein VN258_18620 [Mobilitalea sp.]|nr:hypothetical protein [Mobilitalea sp.]
MDSINHEWLQSNVPMDKSVMKQFLKSMQIISREKTTIMHIEKVLTFVAGYSESLKENLSMNLREAPSRALLGNTQPSYLMKEK